MVEDGRSSMWWRASTTMRLAHTPELDSIAPLPVRRQRDAKGLDTLAGGTPVRMYRQRLPGPPRVRIEPAGGAISQRCAGWTTCSRRERAGMSFPPWRDPRGARPPPAPHASGGSDSCLIRARPAALAVWIPPFPPASSGHSLDWRAWAHQSLSVRGEGLV
jgi:hypothetical protein